MSASSESPPRQARPWLGLVLFLIGLALFVWLLERLNLEGRDIRDAFGRVGWWFGAILALTLVRFGVRATAWLALANARVPLVSATAATIAGDALGNVLPVGLVASEPAKAVYLRRFASPDTLLASLAAENFFYSVSVALYVILATSAMLVGYPNLDRDVYLAGQIALAGMGAVLVAALWLVWWQPAAASAAAARVPIAKVRTLVERIRQLETNAYAAVSAGGWRLGLVVVCETAFHVLSLIECWLTFWLLTGVTSIVPALVYDGFNRVVNIVAKPIPGRMFVEEGGTAALARALGYDPASGFLLAVIRKIRMLVFAAIGLALWARRQRA